MAPNATTVIHKHVPFIEDALNIVIIGTGGTGGYVAKHTLRLLGGIQKEYAQRLRLTLVDPDTFAERNLGRQECTPQDIGKNKAEVLLTRYAKHFNVVHSNLGFLPEAINSSDDVLKLLYPSSTNIIIDCLDKTTPRKHIHDAYKRAANAWPYFIGYIVSAGNEEWNGQVMWGAILKIQNATVERHEADTKLESPGYFFSVPLPYVKEPRLTDVEVDKVEEALSCGERAARNIQSLAANNLSAALCFNYVNTMVTQFINMYNHPDKNASICTGQIYFDAMNNGFKSIPLTGEYLDGPIY